MASLITLTILLGFATVFSCLEPLQVATKIQASPSQSGFARFAAGALLPAVSTTFGLTLLLLFAHMRALSRGAGGAGLHRLAKATLAAASVALIAGGVMSLVAD